MPQNCLKKPFYCLKSRYHMKNFNEKYCNLLFLLNPFFISSLLQTYSLIRYLKSSKCDETLNKERIRHSLTLFKKYNV